MLDPVPTFFVATPCADLPALELDATIRSLVAQEGAFHIAYSINEADAPAEVRSLLAEWIAKIQSGEVRTGCLGLTVTPFEQWGIGLGDVLGQSFSAVPFSRDAFMTALPCGDTLAPGSLAAVAAVMTAMPDLDLVRGLSSAFDENGLLLPPDRTGVFDTWLAIGAASNSAADQPLLRGGMFWRSVIWHRLGGMDPTLSHACDLDFCSKAAAAFQTAFIEAALTVQKPRRLAAQDLSQRHAELIAVQQRAALRQKRLIGRIFDQDDPNRLPGIRPALRVHYDPEEKQWLAADPTDVMDVFGLVEIGSGFLPVEGPYPSEELYSPFRWTSEQRSHLSVTATAPKQQVYLRIRNPSANQTVALFLNDELVFQKRLRTTSLVDVEEISITRIFKLGRNDLVLAADVMHRNEAGVSVGVIVEGVEVVAIDP